MSKKYLAFVAVAFSLVIATTFLFFATSNEVRIDEETRLDSSEEMRFTDVEEGFNNESPSYTDEYIPEPVVLQQMEGRPFFGWEQYWQDLSPEEERYYRGTARKTWDGFKVGIQSGHWQVEEVPEELAGLKRNGSGAQGGGTNEAVVVLEISRRVQVLLEEGGITVDLLPATIPLDYYADAFVSIHADGSSNSLVSGFKISESRRDFSGKADALVATLYDAYKKETGMRLDQNVTRRMSSYYAFNFRRYDHALHPFTPAVIIETGFLTNAADRTIIVSAPERPALGIANGILEFLGIQ